MPPGLRSMPLPPAGEGGCNAAKAPPLLLAAAALAALPFQASATHTLAGEDVWEPAAPAGPLWEVPGPMDGSLPLPLAGDRALPPAAVSPMDGLEPFAKAATYPIAWPGEASPAATAAERETGIHRPWAKRFELAPPKAPPGTERKEFRAGYQHFKDGHQHHPVAPNSTDRSAESTTIFVFVLAAFGMVVGAGLSMERLQAAAHPEKHLLGLAMTLCLPWLLAMGWLIHVAIGHFERPSRVESPSWHCNVAVWYLLVVPVLTALNIMVQALWLSGLHRGPEKPAALMGRMMPSAALQRAAAERALPEDEKPGEPLKVLVSPGVRYTLLGLEVVAMLTGMVMVCEGQLCEPEVYWALAGLVVATAAALLAAPAVLSCGYIAASLGGFVAARGGCQSEEQGLVETVDSVWDDGEES